MYNFLAAFCICGFIVIIGELVSTWTKAWIPSVFVSACLLLVGYWTVIPYDLVKDSFLTPFGATLGIYLLIVHMGTVISLKTLMEQWKTVVMCLVGLAGMCIFALLLCPLFMDWAYIVAGLPPLTGGIVAATIMQQAATEHGLTSAAVFAITMYCVQGFAGYPLTAIFMKAEGAKLLKEFREGQRVSQDEVSAVKTAFPAHAAVKANQKHERSIKMANRAFFYLLQSLTTFNYKNLLRLIVFGSRSQCCGMQNFFNFFSLNFFFGKTSYGISFAQNFFKFHKITSILFYHLCQYKKSKKQKTII